MINEDKVKKMHEASINKEFVKGYDLPIHIFRNYEVAYTFNYLLFLYDNSFYSVNKYERFKSSINMFNTVEEFFEHKDAVLNNIVNYIKYNNSKAADNLANLDIYNLYNDQNIVPMCKNLYTENYTNKTFLSIDLKQGGFSCIKYYDLVPEETYEELMSKFTNVPFLIESRQLRQMIMGHITPKKQKAIQKYFINYIHKVLMNDKIPKDDGEISINNGSDELLIPLKESNLFINFDDLSKYVQLMINNDKNIPFNVNVNVIKLNKISSECYIRELLDENRKVLKATPRHLYPQYYKKYIKGQDITQMDLMFECEGYLSRFIETIEGRMIC